MLKSTNLIRDLCFLNLLLMGISSQAWGDHDNLSIDKMLKSQNAPSTRYVKADHGVTLSQGTATGTTIVDFAPWYFSGTNCSGFLGQVHITGSFTFASGTTYYIDSGGLYSRLNTDASNVRSILIELKSAGDIDIIKYCIPSVTCSNVSSTCVSTSQNTNDTQTNWIAVYP
jgi:hypothetical protein